jgi:hypothetical protein
MGFLSKAVKGVAGGLLGGAGGQLLGLFGDKFMNPSTRGLSAAERKALDDAKLDEDDRRKRLLENLRRRSRVALGVQGGQRTLLYGSFSGTPQP